MEVQSDGSPERGARGRRVGGGPGEKHHNCEVEAARVRQPDRNGAIMIDTISDALVRPVPQCRVALESL